MGKKNKKQKTFKIYEYWTDEKVFSDLHISKVFEKGWDNRIEALDGVKVIHNLDESDQAWRGTVEFRVPGEAIYFMGHDGTIYVSATIYQLREELDQCGGCRNRKHKVKTIFSLDVEKEVDTDRQQWIVDKQAERNERNQRANDDIEAAIKALEAHNPEIGKSEPKPIILHPGIGDGPHYVDGVLMDSVLAGAKQADEGKLVSSDWLLGDGKPTLLTVVKDLEDAVVNFCKFFSISIPLLGYSFRELMGMNEVEWNFITEFQKQVNRRLERE
jgi:hypothetical protein